MAEAAPVPPGRHMFDSRVVSVGFVLDQVSLWQIRPVSKYRHAPVSADSVSTVYSGPNKNVKIKEINSS
jgi:hypothetical protein